MTKSDYQLIIITQLAFYVVHIPVNFIWLTEVGVFIGEYTGIFTFLQTAILTLSSIVLIRYFWFKRLFFPLVAVIILDSLQIGDVLYLFSVVGPWQLEDSYYGILYCSMILANMAFAGSLITINDSKWLNVHGYIHIVTILMTLAEIFGLLHPVFVSTLWIINSFFFIYHFIQERSNLGKVLPLRENEEVLDL